VIQVFLCDVEAPRPVVTDFQESGGACAVDAVDAVDAIELFYRDPPELDLNPHEENREEEEQEYEKESE
jgi:hypothetical protein